MKKKLLGIIFSQLVSSVFAGTIIWSVDPGNISPNYFPNQSLLGSVPTPAAVVSPMPSPSPSLRPSSPTPFPSPTP